MPEKVKKQEGAARKQEELMTERYMELQLVASTMQEMQGTIKQLDEQLVEINSIKANLDRLGKSKPGSEMLVPLNNGIFVKGRLEDNKELVVNVGSNVAVRKTIPDTKQLLDERMKELEAFRSQLLAELEKVGERAQALESELVSLMPK